LCNTELLIDEAYAGIQNFTSVAFAISTRGISLLIKDTNLVFRGVIDSFLPHPTHLTDLETFQSYRIFLKRSVVGGCENPQMMFLSSALSALMLCNGSGSSIAQASRVSVAHKVSF
jgi:hypothetical protein